VPIPAFPSALGANAIVVLGKGVQRRQQYHEGHQHEKKESQLHFFFHLVILLFFRRSGSEIFFNDGPQARFILLFPPLSSSSFR
jgi:hypothetical protein